MSIILDAPDSRDAALPSGVRVRPGLAIDEFAAFEVMRRATGHEVDWRHHSEIRRHIRESSGAAFWVAEDDGVHRRAPRIVAYARSIVRDGVWSLTEFFALPGYQAKRIGGALLDRCLQDDTGACARARFVLASLHAGAGALYMRKAGCFPRLPMLLLAGPLDSLRAPGPGTIAPPLHGREPRAGVRRPEAERLVLTPDVARALDTLDYDAVGYNRPEEHAFWADQNDQCGGPSRVFRRDGEIVGYAYMGAHSSGPAVARNPADLPHMLALVTAALRRSADRSAFPGGATASHSIAVPGSNEHVLRWLLACGWRIVFQYVLMSSQPMGSLERYVCHNPLCLL